MVSLFNRESNSSKCIQRAEIEKIAIRKFQSSGHGLTYIDLQKEYAIEKYHAQRSLKHLRARKVLFNARDLVLQGIHLVDNKNPQQYFLFCRKGEIIEKLKKRKYSRHNNFRFEPLTTTVSFTDTNPSLEEKKANTLLDTFLLLPYSCIYIHKLQLVFHIKTLFYAETKENSRKSDMHEEMIGRRHVRYIISSNGTVQVFVQSNDTPFRLESELDEGMMFSFLGQVRDRLLYTIGDVKELIVPSIMEWKLLQCDVNKDVEIHERGQLTLPDIQLKYASRVFREYVKVIEGKAYFRVEESLKLNEILSIALKNIRLPFVSVEKRIKDLESKCDYLMEVENQRNGGTSVKENEVQQSETKERGSHNAH